jgi:antitoxin component YwqK of YwqJK toxin-antitoxin module
MKFSILIAFFFASVTAISAQKFRSDTLGNRQILTYFYEKGGDSARYVLKEGDTVLQAINYYRNGNIEEQSWARDSQCTYDVFGRAIKKRYSYKNYYFDEDNSVSFFKNGRVSKVKSLINGVEVVKEFLEDGTLYAYSTEFSVGSSHFKQNLDGHFGRYSARRDDTLGPENNRWVRSTDTTFYRNGQVGEIETKENGVSLGTKIFNKQGVLTETRPPDSLRRVIFKDNVDCFYGLKNRRGDTILKPRFYELHHLKNDFFLANNGNAYFVYDHNGLNIKLPFENVTDLGELHRNYSYEKSRLQKKEVDVEEDFGRKFIDPAYFWCITDGKYAVLDEKFQIVIPPQYLTISGYYLGNGELFTFSEMKMDTSIRRGFMSRSGKILFDTRFKDADYIGFDDYFRIYTGHHDENMDGSYTNNSVENLIYAKNFNQTGFPLEKMPKIRVGLGRSDGTVVLKPDFCAVDNIDKTPLFLVVVAKIDKQAQNGKFCQGIFNAQTNRWILDTQNFKVIARMTERFPYFIVENVRTKKKGFMDTAGRFVVSLKFDSIETVYGNDSLFVVKNKEKYQLLAYNNGVFNLHPKPYDFLQPIELQTHRYEPTDNVYYFIAQLKEKWGVVDVDEKMVKPFEFDYARTVNERDDKFILVKNNRAACFDLASLPNEMPMPEQEGQLQSYAVLNDPTHVFFVNDTGKVVIPPQYKWLNGHEHDDYALVLDEKKHKKLIFYATGAVVDFPFDYKIVLTNPKSRVIGVQDTATSNYGFVSTDGKILMPCNNFSIALADTNLSVFFVRHDAPKIEIDTTEDDAALTISADTLSVEDENWFMYDGDGKLMDKTPFNFPIAFQNGVGVGRQNDVFNLYRHDGAILKLWKAKTSARFQTSPTLGDEKGIYTEGSSDGFSNIRRDRQTGFYTLYRNQGLTPSVILTKPDGEIVVESGRYDGISEFFGSFALVSNRNLIGLIDSFGQVVIAPQDLRSAKIDFMDSLYKYVNHAEGFFRLDDEKRMPFTFRPDYRSVHADLEKFPAQHGALFNLMLQENVPQFVLTASDFRIPRAKLKIKSDLFYEVSPESAESLTPEISHLGDKTISVVWKLSAGTTQRDSRFSNFYKPNDRWEDLLLNNLLDIQGEKRWLMNDLLTKKIKALTDGEIDCNNPSAFIKQAENQWQITKSGLLFCFQDSHDHASFVYITFTWAELKPFLKLRIY